MSDVQINVSNDLIKGIVEQKINAAIVGALAGQEHVVHALVDNALKIKVRHDGTVDTYGYNDSLNLIEWLCKDAIKKAIEKAVREWVNAQQGMIAKNVEQHLKTHSKGFAEAFAEGLAASVKSSWNMQIKVLLNGKE